MAATRKKVSRKPGRDQARSRILAAALHLFRTRGVEHVTFGDVAKRARASRPLVYFYFPTFEVLIKEAVLAGLEELRPRFGAAIAGARSGLEATEAIGRTYLAFQLEKPDLFFICMAAGSRARAGDGDTDLDRRLRAADEAVMDVFTGVLERGMKDGSVTREAGAPLMIALCLWAMTHGLAQFSATQGVSLQQLYGTTPRDVVEAGLGLLRRAIRAKG